MIKPLCAIAAALLCGPVAIAVPVISTLQVSSTQQGANTTIDRNHSTTWNLPVASGFIVRDITGSFVLKEGQRTADPITFSLFAGLNASGSMLATSSVSAGSIGQSWNSESPALFKLFNVNITAGDYSLKLYSPALDGGDTSWFFKGANTRLTYGNIAARPSNFLLATPVLEPGTLALLGLGLVGLGAGCRRNACGTRSRTALLTRCVSMARHAAHSARRTGVAVVAAVVFAILAAYPTESSAQFATSAPVGVDSPSVMGGRANVAASPALDPAPLAGSARKVATTGPRAANLPLEHKPGPLEKIGLIAAALLMLGFAVAGVSVTVSGLRADQRKRRRGYRRRSRRTETGNGPVGEVPLA